jgi:ubiquinone/menaquinone biosynthesis C-methylase UbiE
MQKKDPDKTRGVVRKKYSEIVKNDSSKTTIPVFCCGEPLVPLESLSSAMGYSQEQLASVPHGANMGLGCGNPLAIASLKRGETIVDLGSGGGFDCFLAAKQVGESGRVIGVDMTAEMISKARDNATKGGYSNVEFRLGEIEHLPVADGTADVIISNCVVNLSPEKLHVFREAFRILKPGGRLAITDVVASAPLPPEFKNDSNLLSGCIAGAATIKQLNTMLQQVGFIEVRICPLDKSRMFIKDWFPDLKVEDYVVSATIEAVKPSA